MHSSSSSFSPPVSPTYIVSYHYPSSNSSPKRSPSIYPVKPYSAMARRRFRAVLDRLMAALQPKALAMSPELVALIGPQPERSPPSTDELMGKSGKSIDTLSAARSLVASVVGPLFAPDRAQRLMIQHALDEKQLSLPGTIDVLVASLIAVPPPEDDTLALLQAIAADEATTALIALSVNKNARYSLCACW